MNEIITVEPFKGNIEKRIEQIERELEIQIYPDYRKLVKKYNVSKPSCNFYNKDRVAFSLNYFFGISENIYEDFEVKFKVYKGRMPTDLYPIGSVDGGDLLCIHQENGTIYYWFHEADDWGIEGNLKEPTLVGKDLNEFIEQLTPSEKPTKQEVDGAIKNSTITINPEFVKIKNDIREKQGLPPLTLEQWEAKLNGIYDPDESQPYKTHQGKNYSKGEWDAYERKQWEKYKQGKK